MSKKSSFNPNELFLFISGMFHKAIKFGYQIKYLFVCLFVLVHGISTFLGYLTPNPFLYK